MTGNGTYRNSLNRRHIPTLCRSLTAVGHDAAPDLAVVTGAFSYAGKYEARRLLGDGVRVRTLTRSPDGEDLFGGLVEAAPLDFSNPDGLRRSMQGAGVLYNTHWVRFGQGLTTFDRAVENSKKLFKTAERAGVGRIVHFSVANTPSGARLPYYRGKGQVEETLKGIGVPYAIIRPTLVFGVGDLLLNNMAWALRRFPVFPVYGNGDYPVQPVYAGDLAAQAVEAASQSESIVADAAGSETFSFKALLRLLSGNVRGTAEAAQPQSWTVGFWRGLAGGGGPTGKSTRRPSSPAIAAIS